MLDEYRVLLVSSSVFLALFIFLINDINNKFDKINSDKQTTDIDKKNLIEKLKSLKVYTNLISSYFMIFILFNLFKIYQIMEKFNLYVLKNIFKIVNQNYSELYYLMSQLAFLGLLYILYIKRTEIVKKLKKLQKTL